MYRVAEEFGVRSRSMYEAEMTGGIWLADESH